jgi:hypothetical protein
VVTALFAGFAVPDGCFSVGGFLQPIYKLYGHLASAKCLFLDHCGDEFPYLTATTAEEKSNDSSKPLAFSSIDVVYSI